MLKEWTRWPLWSLTTCKSLRSKCSELYLLGLTPFRSNNLRKATSRYHFRLLHLDFIFWYFFPDFSNLFFSFAKLFPIFKTDVLTAASSKHRKSERTNLNWRLKTESPLQCREVTKVSMRLIYNPFPSLITYKWSI